MIFSFFYRYDRNENLLQLINFKNLAIFMNRPVAFYMSDVSLALSNFYFFMIIDISIQ